MSHRTNIGSNHSASHTPKLLQDVLKNIPPGELQAGDSQHILRVLTECWDQLRGATETSMRAFKLGRAERLTWNPPILSFTMERHGGTVLGSTRAELQDWTVDVETGIADCSPGGRRQLVPVARSVDVVPIAARVFETIDEGPASTSDLIKAGTVTWQGERQVIIKHSALIPNHGFQQTVAGRRRRLRTDLRRGMAERGWQLLNTQRYMTFERKG